jgi:hypothetical protein
MQTSAKKYLADDEFPDISSYYQHHQEPVTAKSNFFLQFTSTQSEYISRVIIIEIIVLVVLLALIIIAWRYYYSYIVLLLSPPTPLEEEEEMNNESIQTPTTMCGEETATNSANIITSGDTG